MSNKLPNDYFPHDFNARIDRKILRCRKVLGIEGYGIYWMLIETLCLQENFSYPLKDVDLLADDFGCSVEKVEAVIKQFELFQIDKDAKFFSLSLIARMQKYLELSEKARQNVNRRWEKARKLKEIGQNDTTVLLPYYEGNTIKEYNIKEKNIIEDKHIPELSEFLAYCKTLSIYHQSFDFQIEAKYNSWKENKWKDGNNKQIRNWKTKIQNTMPYFKKDYSKENKKGGMVVQKDKSQYTKDEWNVLINDTCKTPYERKEVYEKYNLDSITGLWIKK